MTSEQIEAAREVIESGRRDDSDDSWRWSDVLDVAEQLFAEVLRHTCKCSHMLADHRLDDRQMIYCPECDHDCWLGDDGRWERVADVREFLPGDDAQIEQTAREIEAVAAPRIVPREPDYASTRGSCRGLCHQEHNHALHKCMPCPQGAECEFAHARRNTETLRLLMERKAERAVEELTGR